MGNEQPLCFKIIDNNGYTLHCKSPSKTFLVSVLGHWGKNNDETDKTKIK